MPRYVDLLSMALLPGYASGERCPRGRRTLIEGFCVVIVVNLIDIQKAHERRTEIHESLRSR